MKYLTKALSFPPLSNVHSTGIVAFGGDLSVPRLKLAYDSGIFPWFEDGEPITWWSPNKRMVLFFDELKISKSMQKILDKQVFTVTFNQCFREVISNCQTVKRVGQKGTWITEDMIDAYCKMHEEGLAKSVEVWQDGELVGGLYGVDLGHIFCGESMFAKASNASKVAFIHLVKHLKAKKYDLLDCQVHNDHLASLGAREISRNVFLAYLKK
ncbi:MAG: leucyl/phenylalanyl-tRNA--protein transferase [Flavobacterium sp.]|nr:leucyl/phenylalanyl-tRNA--protein transferase [Candidatus Neoflavobacterium equi]